ncbi:MAG TPA: hypothetical protein VN798_03955, partial [Pseudomonas sp.]|nr:hypothetical protein [Pseudomonas sp.]
MISSRPVEAQARVYFDQCAGDVECRADARTRIEGGVKLDKSLTAQTDFYLFAVIAALVLVHARWALPAAIIAPSNSGFWRCCVRIVSNRRFMGFSLLAAIAFTCHFAFIAISPLIFLENMGLTQLEFSFVLLIYGAAYVAGGIVASR